MTRIYLAGPIIHSENDGRGWRGFIKNVYGEEFDLLDPLDLNDTTDKPHEEWDIDNIVEGDLGTIDGCDALFVNWEAGVQSCGTPMEMFYAHHCLDIPIVVKTDLDPQNRSPWLRYHSDTVVHTLCEGIEAIRDLA